MSRYNRQRTISKKEFLYRVAGLIGMIAILAVFLPKGGYNKYEYKIGEPWDDALVIAQDSFPVYKSEDQLERESDSLRKYYEPYFEFDRSIYVSIAQRIGIPSKTAEKFITAFKKKGLIIHEAQNKYLKPK